MNQDNGGIIGKINTPTTSVASGVWSLQDQFEAQTSSIWPLAFPQTTFTNSCRFNDGSSDYLEKAQTGSNGNQKTWTISMWVKRATLGTSQFLFSFGENDSSDGKMYFDSNDFLVLTNDGQNGSSNETDMKFRDTSAWYHIIWACDVTQSDNADRWKVYVNGNQITLTGTVSISNADGIVNRWNGYDNWIGAAARSQQSGTALQSFDGYMTEVIFIDGQQLSPTDLGAFNPVTNIWEPIAYAGTYGTNGYKLNFADSSALGDDTSGNGNDFTANNLTSIDQSTDTCSNNFATYNSIFGMGRQDQLTYSEGNTVVVSGATSGSDTTATSTFAFDSGKWYAEFKLTSDANGAYVGVATSNLNFTNSGIDTSGNSNCWITRGDDGTVRNNGSTTYFGTSFSNNDIIQIAIDMDNSKIWWGLNGTYGNSGNPATGANAAYSNLSGELMIIVGDNFSSKTPTMKANFGSPSFSISSGNADANGHGNFEYAVPSGYFALNTKNLAEFG